MIHRAFAAVVAILAFTWATPSETRAAGPYNKATNIVYVESNDPAGNAILAFSRDATGALTPLPGSPFPTGGLGTTLAYVLGPYDSDQNIVLNPSRDYLFAVNGGSGSISVFRVAPGGALTPVAGSPFPSGGDNPVSVGLTGNTLCVVNKDQDPGQVGTTLPNYTSFQVGPYGQLFPVPRSTFNVAAGSSPSQALVRPFGGRLFGADFMAGLVRSFSIAPNGRLVPTSAVTLPASLYAGTGAPVYPLGLALHPSLPLLYVGLVTINRMAVFQYDNNGGLHYVTSVPNSGHGICWVKVNAKGTRLYTSNTGDPSVSVYDLTVNPSSPTEIQKVVLRSTGGGYQFSLDSSESFLHVVTQQDSASKPLTSNGINVLKVNADGTLTEVPSSPTVLPGTVRPQGVTAL